MMHSPVSLLDKGKIALKRKKGDFEAGFCLICDSLSSLAENLSLLHPVEQEYYDNLRYDKRKLSYLLGRKAAKAAISEITGRQDFHLIHIDHGIFQFPVVKYTASQNIQVSISHCDSIGAALAFPEEHPLGIDIESIDFHKSEVMKTRIGLRELELIENCNLPLPVGCTVIWTVKESLSKIFRTGLTFDFRMMEIKSLERSGRIYISTFCHFVQYKAFSLHAGNYICSIVLPMNTLLSLENFYCAFHNIVPKQD